MYVSSYGSENYRNSHFMIVLDEYEIKIFNRWGESVFKSTDINNSWNGRVDNTGDFKKTSLDFFAIL